MDEIKINDIQFPDKIEDLKQWDEFLSARKPTYEHLLKSVSDWETATEEEKRILKRGQDEAEHLIDIRIKIGEITARMDKATKGNQYTGKMVSNNDVTDQKTKESQLSELGMTKMQASRYETLARPENKEIVERAKARARENNDLVTQTEILRDIKVEKDRPHLCKTNDDGSIESVGVETNDGVILFNSKVPHVSHNSRDDNEWYIPIEIIESVRKVLGKIELDPASDEFGNSRVKADKYYSKEIDGVKKEWYGKIWLNPPYSSDSIKPFAEKLINSNFNEAIVLVNNATETEWFNIFMSKATAYVFPKGRIQFDKKDGKHGSPLQGQAFIYFGNNENKFLNEFKKYGWGDIHRG